MSCQVHCCPSQETLCIWDFRDILEQQAPWVMMHCALEQQHFVYPCKSAATRLCWLSLCSLFMWKVWIGVLICTCFGPIVILYISNTLLFPHFVRKFKQFQIFLNLFLSYPRKALSLPMCPVGDGESQGLRRTSCPFPTELLGTTICHFLLSWSSSNTVHLFRVFW